MTIFTFKHILFGKIQTGQRKLSRKHLVSMFLCFFITALLYNFGITELVAYIAPTSLDNGLHEYTKPVIFILLVIIAPLVETLLGQYLPIELLLRFKKIGKPYVCLTTSALLFAAAHSYNWVYMTVMIFPGFLLAYYYWLVRQYSGRREAFYWVVLLHATMNFVAFLINYAIGGY